MKLTPRLETLLQFGKFLIVGVINTAVGFGSILILINLIGIQYQIANIIGYGLGVACSFVLNKFFTFKSKVFHAAEIVKFLLAFAICYSIQFGATTLAHEIVRLDVNLSTLIGMALYTAANFLLNKYITFAYPSRREPNKRPPA